MIGGQPHALRSLGREAERSTKRGMRGMLHYAPGGEEGTGGGGVRLSKRHAGPVVAVSAFRRWKLSVGFSEHETE